MVDETFQSQNDFKAAISFNNRTFSLTSEPHSGSENMTEMAARKVD